MHLPALSHHESYAYLCMGNNHWLASLPDKQSLHHGHCIPFMCRICPMGSPNPEHIEDTCAFLVCRFTHTCSLQISGTVISHHKLCTLPKFEGPIQVIIKFDAYGSISLLSATPPQLQLLWKAPFRHKQSQYAKAHAVGYKGFPRPQQGATSETKPPCSSTCAALAGSWQLWP